MWPSALISLFGLALFGLCQAGNVTVTVNDTRLVTSPPNLWNPRINSQDRYGRDCGGYRYLFKAGESVSLVFNGTAITINLMKSSTGTKAQIAIDGTNVTLLDTYEFPDPVCRPLTWSMGALSPTQQHTATVTRPTAPAGADPAQTVVYLRNEAFVYDSLDSETGNGSMSNSKRIGIIVGSVVGGLVLVLLVGMGIIHLRRRREKTAAMRTSWDTNQHQEFVPFTVPSPRAPSSGSPGFPHPVVDSSAVPNPYIWTQHPTPSTDSRVGSPPNPALASRLSQAQLTLVNRLMERNVSGAAITAVIESMLDGRHGGPNVTGDSRQDSLPSIRGDSRGYDVPRA